MFLSFPVYYSDILCQPRPDPALWTTDSPTASIVADDASKVNLVHPDFKEHPATVYSENRPPPDDTPSPRNKKNRRLREAEAEGLYLWQITKQYLFRPGVAGGLIGISTHTFNAILFVCSCKNSIFFQ